MDLERLAVTLRPRRGWESVDLGIALVRRLWPAVYGPWLAVAAPASVLLITLLPAWGWLIAWWLMPLSEAAALHALSRAVFGTFPTLGATVRALPGLWRRTLAELFWRRLRPGRILELPIGQLEGLRGRDRRRRAAVLAAGQNVAGLLPLTFVPFELGCVLAVVAFAVLMTPSWAGVDWELLIERFFNGSLPTSFYVACQLVVAAVVLALHPLYVGAGFALYLNRRTELEGWDLEIAFRRLAARLEASGTARAVTPDGEVGEDESSEPPPTGNPPEVAPSAGLAALVLALTLTVAGTYAGEARAQPQDPAPAETADAAETAAVPPAAWQGDPARDPRAVVREVLELPPLQRYETVRRWRLRPELLEDRGPRGREVPAFFATLARLLAAAGEPLAWTLLVVALWLLLREAWKRLPSEASERAAELPPERVAGLDLRPETLPSDIPGTARSLWQRGRHAEALSLLYRGALARLAAGGAELRESFTESDCLRAAKRTLAPAGAAFFAELTGAWQAIAYAHRVPETDRAERLWSAWDEHFEVTP